jgi:hypothetical protein
MIAGFAEPVDMEMMGFLVLKCRVVGGTTRTQYAGVSLGLI